MLSNCAEKIFSDATSNMTAAEMQEFLDFLIKGGEEVLAKKREEEAKKPDYKQSVIDAIDKDNIDINTIADMATLYFGRKNPDWTMEDVSLFAKSVVDSLNMLEKLFHGHSTIEEKAERVRDMAKGAFFGIFEPSASKARMDEFLRKMNW